MLRDEKKKRLKIPCRVNGHHNRVSTRSIFPKVKFVSFNLHKNSHRILGSFYGL